MSGENRNVSSPFQRISCTSTPDDITRTFNSNQFWSYPFQNTEDLLPKTMNSSFTTVTTPSPKIDEAVNNNDIIIQEESLPKKVMASKSSDNINKQKEKESSNNVKTVIVPTNFNSLNELTEEELLILIEDRRKAAEAAEINMVPNLSEGGYSRKSTPAVNPEYSTSTKGSTRRVSDTHAIKQDAALDTRRKSLPSSKNFLHGFLQNFVLSAGRKETSPVDTVKEVETRYSPNASLEIISRGSPNEHQNFRQSPNVNQENPIDLTVKKAHLSPDEEVRVINAGVLQMEVSPDREPDINGSLNRTPVASGCSRTNRLKKITTGTPKSSTLANDKPSSPELQYPSDQDFGYVSPIPVNERFNSTLTYSDSPKRNCQSPILSCSFTDPTYQYVSDNSDNGGDSSFERDFDTSDLMSFEDPALEKSPFVKYTVELRAKLAARVASGDGTYKPSPFLFSPRNTSNPKLYAPASDRHLHFLQEETTLDFENNDISELIPQEEHECKTDSLEELKIVGTVTEASGEQEKLQKPSVPSDVNDPKKELIAPENGGTSVNKTVSKKTVWAQLVENIELHIIRGNKAGFIACLNSHGRSFPCV